MMAVTRWRAEDGKEFNTKEECMRYEASIRLKEMIAKAVPGEIKTTEELLDWMAANTELLTRFLTLSAN